MNHTRIALVVAAIGAAGFTVDAAAQAKEQFVPINGYWVGPYAAGGSGITAGMIDYLQLINEPRRRHQRRQGHVGEVRDRVQQRPRRRVLRAHQEEGPDRRDADPPAVDRHHLFADRQGHGRQGSDRLDRLRSHRRLRRARLPLCLPADHQLLEPEHRQDQVHRPEGRRDGQAEGQEDREHLSRLGLRQGDDPGARRAGEEVRLRGDAHRRCRIRATSSRRSGCRCARSSRTG